ncbi:unnamed protein product, partial [Rotaria sp. Silwood2]
MWCPTASTLPKFRST